ncbi:MAG: hypothetical protein QN131_12715 [Armatimonadota bacterium]|nr:hypothetical protein [Armatimonadota bacterium]
MVAIRITYTAVCTSTPSLATWSTLALGFGTPLLLYSTVYWDHSLTVAFAAGGLALLVGALLRSRNRAPLGRLLAAGALLGLGHWLRNEAYLLTVTVLVAWLLVAPRSRVGEAVAIAAGAGLATAPLWILNSRLFGSPLGWKGQGLVTGRITDATTAVSGRTVGAWLADKLGNAYYQLISTDFYAFNPRAVAIGVGLAALLLLGAIVVRVGIRRGHERLSFAGAILVVGTAIFTISNRTAVSGLLPAAPLVALLALSAPEQRWEWFLWVVVVLFSGAVVVTGTHGGLQWGPRYLLPIVPPLVWLAASAVDRVRRAHPPMWPVLRLAVAGIVGASMLVQLAGVEHVDASLARNRRINETVRAAPAEVVVTSLEWLALGAGPVFFEKRLMLVKSPEEFQALVRMLAVRRVPRWTYIPQSGGRFGARYVEDWSKGLPWRYRVAGDGVYNGVRLVTYAGEAGGR